MNLSNTCASGGFLGLKYSHNRMEMITEKEHKQSPQARTSLKGMDPGSMEVVAIKHLMKRPTEKWDLPVTTSQESGWLIANPVRAESLLAPGVEPRLPDEEQEQHWWRPRSAAAGAARGEPHDGGQRAGAVTDAVRAGAAQGRAHRGAAGAEQPEVVQA
eukprot:SRR837773.15368.p1 GENE.SRR837773.15368~~SRR837773.15368.p1  ORF type:complete len:186 (+),score=50.11 SRR837773.15368:82-558(+)